MSPQPGTTKSPGRWSSSTWLEASLSWHTQGKRTKWTDSPEPTHKGPANHQGDQDHPPDNHCQGRRPESTLTAPAILPQEPPHTHAMREPVWSSRGSSPTSRECPYRNDRPSQHDVACERRQAEQWTVDPPTQSHPHAKDNSALPLRYYPLIPCVIEQRPTTAKPEGCASTGLSTIPKDHPMACGRLATTPGWQQPRVKNTTSAWTADTSTTQTQGGDSDIRQTGANPHGHWSFQAILPKTSSCW